MRCADCRHWVLERRTEYGSGETKTTYKAPLDSGFCVSLKQETRFSFGCVDFSEGQEEQIVITKKEGPIWRHWVMIECPDCRGGKDPNTSPGGFGHRCAGTGLVRLYDDGYIGDERTRKHPKEIIEPPKCPKCGKEANIEWSNCPWCSAKLWNIAKTEVIADEAAGLPPPEPPRAEAAE